MNDNRQMENMTKLLQIKQDVRNMPQDFNLIVAHRKCVKTDTTFPKNRSNDR